MQKFILNALTANCDAPESWQIGIQDSATPIAQSLIAFHNYLMVFLVFIGMFVFWMLYQVIINFNETNHKIPKRFTHSSLLEIIWTILPAIVLLFIAIPSFSLLYSLEAIIDPDVTIKAVGHQWYWSYEYSDYTDVTESGETINFDSYMIPTSDLAEGMFRLIEVDNRVILPVNTHIRVLITAADVIHSWAVPSFGIKVDAVPGRLSEASLFIRREGVYFGQCSEICGVNHGFMPIVIRTVPKKVFVAWVVYKLQNL
jgi:cytochrome c oxidase subunit 2